MAPYRRVRCTRWPSRRQPEEGFTLIEVLVALGIIFSTLLVLAFSMFSSFAAVGFSRQRTQASALANQTIEQIKALPFDMLYMNQSDVASGTDPQIKPCSTPTGSYCFPTATGRVIPAATFGVGTPLSPFFNPTVHTLPDHIATQVGSPGTTNYTIKSYVTIDQTDLTGQTKIATVQVSWTPAQVGGVQPNLQVETKIYSSPFSENSPGATTTTTTPLTHSYLASAQSQAGTISVSGTILNQTLTNATFNLPTASSYLSGNTTAGTSVGPAGHPVTAGSASSGIAVSGISVVNTPGASASASSLAGQATNGPNNNSATPTALDVIPASTQCILCTLIDGTITGGMAVGQTNSASALAASAAGGTAGIPTGVIPNNSLGYGRATATQTGAISTTMGLNVASLPVLNMGLVNVVPTGNSNPDMATTIQTGSSSVPLGQTFTASASKSLTELDVLSGLPVVGTLIKLTGFSAAASSCAAPTQANCPAATATTGGTLSIAGLPTVTFAGGSNALTFTVPPVNVTAGVLNVAVTATVNVGAATTTGSTSASVSSPLSVNVHLGVSSVLLGTIINLNVVVDLGTVSTTASYS